MSNEFKIEKNIPPPSRNKIGNLPFPQMKIGDSFFIEAVGAEQKRQAVNAAGVAARNWGTRNSPKTRFSCKRVDDGVRVWRIADAD